MSLDLAADLVTLLCVVVDTESVSGHEGPLADAVEGSLRGCDHLVVERVGDTVIARTDLGRDERVVIAGHLDTVPVKDNLPSRVDHAGGRVYGRGACDMKGGVAVMLSVAAALTAPSRDVTWIFYDHEEVEAAANGLGRVARERPDLLAGEFAVLMEPTGTQVEGGCQGTMRCVVETHGVAAHSGRAWLGHNAVHDLAPVLATLTQWRDTEIEVDGLLYREGLNAVRIGGGVAGNVIPDRASVEINYRFAPDKSPEQAEAYVRSLFPDADLRVTDMSPGARPGLDRPAAQRFLAAVGGRPRPKYGWTDVARFSALGIPAVNFGPADPGKAHADDEFCPISDLYTCRDALIRWLSGRG
ncbi:MAG: succinyl-diaminopimelate desuccinylase [Propionibacterium sp.]|nr:succinyl-diaminopimelate desuccinylase [Propionibacterium sp.]